MSLKGKSIFITGGTGGIGAPLVELLRDAGGDVIVFNRKESGDLAENIDAISQMLSHLAPDILINMAGYNECAHCEDQHLNDLIALNLTVPMRLSQAVLPAMKQRNSGQIINIGSMMGIIPLPYYSGYVAAKAGIKAFSDCLRRELCDTAIRVTLIAPRAVQTRMNQGISHEINSQTGTAYDAPEIVAKRIVDAIVLGEKEVRFGKSERFFAFMNANFPSVVDSGLRKNVKVGEAVFNSHKALLTQVPATELNNAT
ncbi:SDR family NAD(P)-dependent oxidoreductase [uncultured Amphritea sp.]|uniref:SDR family NAD(P)-dependent oxidoreductase n=1 Tax=uncultured Amphritea sp. TaxID=981605 RepID=UPI002626D7CF|nr:SDR family NAD(P)-dependent oxidoreductase [uncultured Amphritea sp.]